MVRPQKDFERLDPALFRAFMAAVETRNFTRAAHNTSMTQSGVSQHIAKLEAQLGVELFTRVNKSVLLTDAGKKLAKHVEQYLEETDALCEHLKQSTNSLVGLVSYALPGSCIFSPHLGMMLERRAEHPDIELKVFIKTNEEIVGDILNGELDFGFVTRSVSAPGLNLKSFCQEEFILVGRSGSLPKNPTLEQIVQSQFISYPGMDDYFDAWQRHHFPKTKRKYFDALPVKGYIENIHGAVTLLKSGVGLAIIPKHCVQGELDRRELIEIVPSSKKASVLNDIYIATLANQRPTKRAQQVMNWFFEM